ncbi:MAG: cytochrome c biogenesis protein ResB [Bacteroidales bacterium]|nr:cytochrome c biogenesis protein ResB [Bacteroidales bacterium]
MDKKKKHIWQSPWGYIESFLIAGSILIIGWGIDLITHTPVPLMHFPVNIIAFFTLILVMGLLFRVSTKIKGFKWFFSVPASLSAIVLFAVLSLIIALVPQTRDFSTPLRSVTSGWAYFLSYLYLLLTLGVTWIKKTVEYKTTSIGFILNHLGLWLALAAAAIGAGDRQKLTMYLKETETVWYAFNEKGESFELPFAVELNDFQLEEYTPKIAIIDNQTGEFIKKAGKPLITDFVVNDEMVFGDYTFIVKEYYPLSWEMGNVYQPVNTIGATPSAGILLTDYDTLQWISSGSFMQNPRILNLTDDHSLIMLKPEPSRYISKVTLYEKDGVVTKNTIEVNKPLKIGGWKVYQVSYDDNMGRWSETSTVELINDPWLRIVYAGCILMVLGAAYLIYNGKKR